MKKDNLSKRLIALSLLGTLTLAHPESIDASQNNNRREVIEESIPTVTAITNVNIREGANINSKKIGTLYANQSLRLYEEYENWYKVGYLNTFGYVNKQYVNITNKVVMHTPSIKNIKVDNTVSLYSDEACTNIIGIVPANTYVNVYLDNPYTYYIKYNNFTGYINKKQINTKPYVNVYEAPIVSNTYIENQPIYIENNYYGPVENNYYYYEDNSKVLIKK